MSIDDKTHISFMNETSKALGGISANISNLVDYVKAVSKEQKQTREALDFHIDDKAKLNDKLNGHVADQKAHGLDTRRETAKDIWSFFGKVLALLISAVGVLVAIFTFLGRWWPK